MSVLMAYITVTKSASTLLVHTHAAATWDIYYTIMEPLAMVKPVLNKISKQNIFSIPCNRLLEHLTWYYYFCTISVFKKYFIFYSLLMGECTP